MENKKINDFITVFDFLVRFLHQVKFIFKNDFCTAILLWGLFFIWNQLIAVFY